MVASVADRVIRVPITRGSLDRDDVVDRMRDLMASVPAAMVTPGSIQAVADGGTSTLSLEGTWAGHTQFWHNEYRRMIGYEAEQVMAGGTASRHQELASYICLGLTVLLSLIADHHTAQRYTSPANRSCSPSGRCYPPALRTSSPWMRLGRRASPVARMRP